MHSLAESTKTLLNKHTQPRQGHADGGSLSERLCLCGVAPGDFLHDWSLY